MKPRPRLAAGLTYEITLDCHHRCLYCYNYQRPLGEKSPPPRGSHQRVLAQARKVFDFQTLTFTGGEPTLVKDLPDLVLSARLQGLGVTLISSGAAWQTQVWEDLILIPGVQWEIPFHSHLPEVHDHMTGKPGSHHRARESLIHLQKTGGRGVPGVVLTALNLPQLPQTLGALADLGFQDIMLGRFNPGGLGLQNLDLLTPTLEELRHGLALAQRTAQERNLRLTSNVCLPHCAVDPRAFGQITMGSCGAHWTQRPLTLTPSGDLRTCNHSPQVVGNIFSKDCQESLEKAETFWQKVPDFCSSCDLWSACRGGCRAAGQQMGRGLDQEDPLVRRWGISRAGSQNPF